MTQNQLWDSWLALEIGAGLRCTISYPLNFATVQVDDGFHYVPLLEACACRWMEPGTGNRAHGTQLHIISHLSISHPLQLLDQLPNIDTPVQSFHNPPPSEYRRPSSTDRNHVHDRTHPHYSWLSCWDWRWSDWYTDFSRAPMQRRWWKFIQFRGEVGDLLVERLVFDGLVGCFIRLGLVRGCELNLWAFLAPWKSYFID